MTDRLKEYIKTLVPICDIKKEENQKELFKNILLGKTVSGKTLFNASHDLKETYYLIDGEIKLTDINNKVTILKSTSAQCRFPIGYDQSHKYSAIALTDISYLKIESETLDTLLTWDQVTTPLLRRPTSRSDGSEINWMSRILELELFHRIPPANIQAMFLRFESIQLQQNETVIVQGAPGDYYYVIKSGRCAIYRSDDVDKDPMQFKLAELGPGDSFGEEALVSDKPRNASVIMRESGELARLSKEDFLALLSDPIMKTVSYEEANELMQAGARFIDARTENEFQHNHLQNSLNLPLDNIRKLLGDLDKALEYIMYCDTGSRSAAACYILNQRGYVAHLLENGLKSVPSAEIQHPGLN